MKSTTLAMMFVAAVAGSAVAQDPTPPARPARPAPAAPAPAAPAAPAPAPRPAARPFDYYYGIDADAIRDQAAEIARMNVDIARMAPRALDIDVDAMREQSRQLADQAREMSRAAMTDIRIDDQAVREMTREANRIAADAMRDFAPMAAFAPMAPMAPMPSIPAIAPMAFNYSRDLGFRTPPAPWAQGDPADSLYRVARNVLQSGDYGRAARLFADISSKYPKSAYANDAPYWEATARYRIGTTEELRIAAKVLEPLVGKMTTSTSGSGSNVQTNVSINGQRGYSYGIGYGKGGTNDNDVATLYARINGQLAQRGDRDAADKVAKVAAQGGTSCDQEEMQVKVEALNALNQMDAGKSVGPLKSVLDRKDECSASLRRNAVFILSRRSDGESTNLLISVAKSDPNYSVRQSAIDALSRVPGDAGFSALEEILRADQDERVQRSIVSALMRSDNVKARTSMRALIDRKDAPVNLRIEAINSFNSDRATADDAAYLRGLYGKAESDNFKRAIIDAVSRIGGTDNDQWLMTLAKNTNESSSIRAEAIGRMMRSNVSIVEIGKLYDAADSYNMRSQIISVLRSRKETEASDKLVDIIKNGTDNKLRSQAIGALQSRNDPRSQQLFQDILDGKKP